MKATAEKIEKNLVKLTVEVDAKEFDKSIQKAYLKNRKHIMIPGFRKGRAPRKVIEQFYGEALFYEDAANDIIPSTYGDAVDETKIEPVAQPEIDIVQIGNGQNFIYTADVVVKPEVELGEYKGIQIDKVEYTVTDQDIEEQLENMREQNARWISIEGSAVEEGHRVTMDYTGKIDGEEFEGGSAENASLEIGSGTFIPGFEEQLIGMNIGDSKDINVTFPENYHEEDFQGKEAIFHVELHDIKEKELPELDDEFAKDISEFDTLDEYRADSREKLEKSAKEQAKAEMESSLVQKIVDNANVDIPEEMVDSEIDRTLNELDYTLRYQGLSLEQYLQFTGTSLDDVRAEHRDQAYNTVKMRLVLEEIAKVEEIQVDDADVEEEFEKMAEQYDRDVEDVKKDFGLSTEALKEHLMPQKTIDFLMDNAIIEVREIDESVEDDSVEDEPVEEDEGVEE